MSHFSAVDFAPSITLSPAAFSQRILDWFDCHGRKHLPWQANPTPYRVWISEIMLQQTQVTTVIPYYQRFLERFPDVKALADARLDEVLHLWSGLGYYARARHLHRAATMIRDHHEGAMPLTFEELSALPGIGRSTAGAILALSTGQRQPILDGNVKRVLTRFHAVEGWPGRAAVANRLWALAGRYTPVARVAEYTQAMMDLGALLCTRTRPRCGACPLADGCQAHREGRQSAFPEPAPRRVLPVRHTRMLLLTRAGREILLEQRLPVGLWGGLWGFPECPPDADIVTWCRAKLGMDVTDVQPWTVIRHSFSHFHLDIEPVRATVGNRGDAVMEGDRFVWYNTREPDARGLAAPVQRLLAILQNER